MDAGGFNSFKGMIKIVEKIGKILKHDLFISCLNQNETAEKDRIFCRHNMAHFLDVARIGRIINAEEGLGIETELIYAAALLHDIGKHQQYAEGVPHELASAQLAAGILQDCGFEQMETDVIIDAIRGHRDENSAKEKNLKGILFRADKLSRACFCCPAEGECNWKDSKKNLKLRY